MPETALRIAGETDRAMPRKINFTVATLANVKVGPDADRTWVYDTKLSNLGFMRTASGGAFYWCGRVRGRRSPIRYQLGGEEIGVEQARNLAREASVQVSKGIDIQAERNRIKAASTFGELWNKYLEQHAKPKKRSWDKDLERYTKHLSAWSGRPAKSITLEDVTALHARIGKTHPGAANRTLALLSAMYSKAAKGMTNPARGVEKFPEHRRDRVLTHDERRRFFAALKRTSQPWADLFEVAILTGQRIGNIRSMRWDELKLVDAIWLIPAEIFKTGKPHEAGLPARVLEILKARQGNESEYVFPAESSTGYVMEPKGPWADLCKRAKLTGVWIHDLRATAATAMAEQNVAGPLIQKALGHKSYSTTERYVRLSSDEAREAICASAAAMKNSTARA